jgi:hypothetical protein
MPQLLWRQSEKGILPHLQGTTPTIATYISALYIHFLKHLRLQYTSTFSFGSYTPPWMNIEIGLMATL